MLKSDVNELKKRFSKDGHNIDRIAGCYVNCDKTKVGVFKRDFLDLEEDEQAMYFDIAKKCLAGKIDNNLIVLDFPLEAENNGGAQHSLLGLRNSALKVDEVLESFYDKIIASFSCSENYMILLFHDIYDVPVKTKDKQNIGESEETYEYILCALCPVDLGKAALGFDTEEKNISIINGSWVTKGPESAFLFPSFEERSADIHKVVLYTKKSTEPHKELMEVLMGCDIVETEDEIRANFDSIASTAFEGSIDNSDEINDMVLLIHKGLYDKLEEHNATFKGTSDENILKVTEDILTEVIEDVTDDEDVKDDILSAYKEMYGEKDIYISKLVDIKRLEKEALRLENMALKKKVARLMKQIKGNLEG